MSNYSFGEDIVILGGVNGLLLLYVQTLDGSSMRPIVTYLRLMPLLIGLRASAAARPRYLRCLAIDVNRRGAGLTLVHISRR